MVDISETAFQHAVNMTGTLRALLAKRSQLAEEDPQRFREFLPGPLWEDVKLFKYCLNPSYDVVNTWRLHTAPFSAIPVSQYLGSNRALSQGAPIVNAFRKLTKDLPREVVVQTPEIMAEAGWMVDETLVNADVLRCQKAIKDLYCSGLLARLQARQGPVRIMEIGAGYGALAYQLKRLLPNAVITIVDLPETLTFSTVYLSVACEENRGIIYDGTNAEEIRSRHPDFLYVPNFLFPSLPAELSGPYDLVINIASMGEMTENQITLYLRAIARSLGETGVFYFENADLYMPVSRLLAQHMACGFFPQDVSGGQKCGFGGRNPQLIDALLCTFRRTLPWSSVCWSFVKPKLAKIKRLIV